VMKIPGGSCVDLKYAMRQRRAGRCVLRSA
jgi:hypothetical protein